VTGAGRLRVNGADLDCVTEGTGVPVLFSHGGGSDLRYWEPQRRAFAARHRFVAYSRRYHGPGPWPAAGDHSTEAHVADLVEILRGLEPGPAHLVGFSTSLALRAVLAAPDVVRTLTIVEPNLPWLLDGDPEGEGLLAWWRAENQRIRDEAAGDRAKAARLWFELVDNRGPGTFSAQPRDFQRMWLENFTATRPPAPSPAPVRCEDLRGVSVPTLVVGAEYGMRYSRRIVDVLAGCIPGARRVVVPRVTHFMSYQNPAPFDDLVLAFLDEN
jgi:pimeloyl-ACP methyl ester carboxylesterase